MGCAGKEHTGYCTHALCINTSTTPSQQNRNSPQAVTVKDDCGPLSRVMTAGEDTAHKRPSPALHQCSKFISGALTQHTAGSVAVCAEAGEEGVAWTGFLHYLPQAPQWPKQCPV